MENLHLPPVIFFSFYGPNSLSYFLLYLFYFLGGWEGIISVLHNHHLRVLGVAFACVVPSCQLLVEEAAEDVRALGDSSGGFVQEESASGGEDG